MINAKPVKLAYNRIWRTYTGGAAIDAFYKKESCKDDYWPEVWIASVVEAVNPEKLEGEGLSTIEGLDLTLRDAIDGDPAAWLGQAHSAQFGKTTGVLTKLLDAAERLTIQVHPNHDKAMALFDSRFGKTEAWYIMDGRTIDGEPPHIYFGFKEGISKEAWIALFKEQDTQGMLEWMHKIPVQSGQVYLIEGGTPHAIGAGCFIMEIQEPTDLTIRPERHTPGGYEIPDRICHQGIGFDKMFEVFDYEGLSYEETLKRWRLQDGKGECSDYEKLIDESHTRCFGLEQYLVETTMTLIETKAYSVLVVLEGEGMLDSDGQTIPVSKGDQIFLPPVSGPSTLSRQGNKFLKVMRCLPPSSKVS